MAVELGQFVLGLLAYFPLVVADASGGRVAEEEAVHHTVLHRAAHLATGVQFARAGYRTAVAFRGAPMPLALGTGDLAEPAAVRGRLDDGICVVADATRDEDLESLVRAVPDPSAVLWAGSAGLAAALAGANPGPHAEAASGSREVAGRVLVVVGSLSEVSRGQLRTLAEERGCETVPVGARSGAVGISRSRWRGRLRRRVLL